MSNTTSFIWDGKSQKIENHTVWGGTYLCIYIYTTSLLFTVIKKNKILEWSRFSKTEQTFYVWTYYLWDKFGMHGLSYLAWRSLPFYYIVDCLLSYVCLDSWNSVKESLAGSSVFFSRQSRWHKNWKECHSFFFILSPFFSRSSLLFFIFISWSDFEPLRKSAYRSFGEKRMSRISDWDIQSRWE